MKYVLLTLLVLAAVFVVVVLLRALRTYLKFRGKMLVSCPETHRAGSRARRRSEGCLGNICGKRRTPAERMLALAQETFLRAEMLGANPRSTKGLPRVDDHQSLVPFAESIRSWSSTGLRINYV